MKKKLTLFEKLKTQFEAFLKDDELRERKQLQYIELLLTFISTGMSIVNIITQTYILLISTASMAVLSFTNFMIIYKKKNNKLTLPSSIFLIKVTLLFTYFVIFGGTDGFSTIWLLLVPACGMFAFGLKKGSLLSLLYLVELVVFFYTPLKDIILFLIKIIRQHFCFDSQLSTLLFI